MSMEANVFLAQGGGGAPSAKLIGEEIISRFGNGPLAGLPDAASLPGGLVFSTDSFVVTPRFFPGGNVGKLAVCGTVNDILVSGGIPQYLSLALVIEDGFSRKELGAILDSVKSAADEAQISVVTGDTKVVPHGALDGIMLNTAGIGIRRDGIRLGREFLRTGDKILVSGSLGEHGMAVLGARHGMSGNALVSDCAILRPFADSAFAAGLTSVKLMRDPTRGGAGAVLQELLGPSRFGALIREVAIPYSDGVKTLSAMTGIDPFFVPCEGRMIAIVSPVVADGILQTWRKLPGGEMAAEIGVLTGEAGQIVLQGEWGALRKMVLPEGDPLPRIC